MKRVILCAVLMAWSTLASAVVYKWVDAQGKTQYGDRPPDGVHAEVVEGLGRDSRPAASPAAGSQSAERSGRDDDRRQESGRRATFPRPARSNARTRKSATRS